MLFQIVLKFTINDVPVGRQNFKADVLGYKTQVIPNVLIVSGKEVFLNINLQEDISNLNEVVVQSEKKNERPLLTLCLLLIR